MRVLPEKNLYSKLNYPRWGGGTESAKYRWRCVVTYQDGSQTQQDVLTHWKSTAESWARNTAGPGVVGVEVMDATPGRQVA